MPAEHCVFACIALDASGHPLGTALRACRRMPSAVCTFAGVPHESVLVRPRKGAPTQYKKVNQMQKSFLSIYRSITLVRRIRRRTFALFTMHFKELNDAIHTKTIP